MGVGSHRLPLCTFGVHHPAGHRQAQGVGLNLKALHGHGPVQGAGTKGIAAAVLWSAHGQAGGPEHGAIAQPELQRGKGLCGGCIGWAQRIFVRIARAQPRRELAAGAAASVAAVAAGRGIGPALRRARSDGDFG